MKKGETHTHTLLHDPKKAVEGEWADSHNLKPPMQRGLTKGGGNWLLCR